jgi:uncharacterized membrane protein
MPKHTEAEHTRVQFQIDRIAFFSDAVIAIALTLMVLEIKIPEIGKDTSFIQMIHQYGLSIYIHTMALLVGFVGIGNLWMKHHELFEHIANYNKRFVRVNLYFLFSIMLLPITISFLFESNEPFHLQLLFYFINLTLCSFTYSRMVVLIYSKKNHFSSLKNGPLIRELKEDSFLGSIAFFVATVLIGFGFSMFYLAFIIIPLFKIILGRKNKTRVKAVHTTALNHKK